MSGMARGICVVRIDFQPRNFSDETGLWADSFISIPYYINGWKSLGA
jgi:hypothetical protein